MTKQIQFYYVYIITNIVLNKQYVGSRICYKDKIEDDNYWGTSKYLKEDYKIYGKHNFIKEILKDNYHNTNDMLNGESEYMHQYNTFAPNGYNRYDPILRKGFHTGGCKHSDKTKNKISESQLGHQPSEKTRNKIAQAMTGKKFGPCSEERKENIRKTQIGKFVSKETCEKISNANRNRKGEKRPETFKQEHSIRMKKYYSEKKALKN